MVRASWSNPESSRHREVVDGLCDALAHLDLPPSAWRGSFAAPEARTPSVASPIDRAVELATATAADGTQRALDVELGDLDDLLELRLEIRTVLAAHPPGSELRRVLVWLWRPESGGRPLTAAGAGRGFELRFSRYRSDRYAAASPPAPNA